MKGTKVVTSSKGRITNPAKAWNVAYREYFDRERITDPDLAHMDALRIQDADEAHEDALDEQDQQCEECARSFGPHYTGPCEHGGSLTVAKDSLPVPAPAVPASDAIALPIKFLQAALVAAAVKDIRYYLQGVYLHGIDGEWRVVATDGHRLVASRIPLRQGETLPAWAEAGIIIPREELTQALPLLSKNALFHSDDRSDPCLLLAYDPERPTFELRCMNGFASFAMRPVDGKFPDYAKVIAASAVNLAREGNEAMKSSCLNVQYIKGAADIATKLGAKGIHSFVNGDDRTAAMFTFEGAPDTVYIVMAMTSNGGVSDGVVKLVGRTGIESSLAAFRAHLTRTRNALASVKGEKERAELEDRRAGIEAKIAHLLNVTTAAGPKQIENRAV